MNHPQAVSAPDRADRQLDEELYAKRRKIYPREVHGLFARLRVLGVLVLLGIYYALPWIPWGGRQAVLLDLPQRKFHIFAWTFWPQDFIFLAALLIIAAFSLFFFTALAGRLWCGYACPQTVWTEVFLWIERKVEGDRTRQMKLDRARWGRRKALLKGGKHLLWIAFALWTGFTFVGYFTPIEALAAKVVHGRTGPWESFWILFYGAATYLNAGWMREQVCIYMCPYARFQSAMFDRDTLVISYDETRGEPRGARPRSAGRGANGRGDCIDCTMCVQVCPTGIDIREGLQYQCIGCAACVDVCDQVMAKMHYPPGLIRYTTQQAMDGQPPRVLRPRIAVYAAILLALTGLFAYGLSQRTPLELDVIRDRNVLYRQTPQGLVENVYTLKLINMDERAHRYVVSVSGLPELTLGGVSGPVPVPAGTVVALPVQVRVDPAALEQAGNNIRFGLRALDAPGLAVDEPARFLGPVPH